MGSDLGREYARYWESKDPERRHVLVVGGISWEAACARAPEDWKAILHQIHLPAKPVIVEWGCGPGRLLRACPIADARMVGVDMSASMLAEAAFNTPSGTTLLRSEDGCTCSELTPGEADLVYTFTVMQHVPTQALVDCIFATIFRTLKPGGVFRMQTHRGPPHPEDGFGGVYGRYFRSGPELAANLEAHGFDRVVTESGFYHADWLWATAWKPR